MLRQISIRQRLVWLALLAVGFVVGSGVAGLYASNTLSASLEAGQVSLQAIRNQGTADMMHDAVRSDVLAMFRVVSTQGGAGEIKAVQDDFAEHRAEFTQRMQQNAALPLSAEERQALEQLKPDVDAYLQQGEQALAAYARGETSAATFAAFMQKFSVLEDSMGAFSDLLEKNAEALREQAVAREESAKLLLHGVLWGGAALIVLLAWALVRSITQPLGQLRQQLATMGCDLRVRLPQNGHDEISAISAVFNQQLARQAELVAALRGAGGELASMAEHFSDDASQLQQHADRALAEVLQAAASAEQITHSATSVGHSAQQAEQDVRLSAELASQSSQRMQEAVRASERLQGSTAQAAQQIATLAERTATIDLVTREIREIAEQTNLLALNAAIEAARAGEFGRGFAVVADEVRKLAERTAASTHQIGKLTGDIRNTTEQAVASVQQVQSEVEGSAQQLQHAQQAQDEIGQRAHQLLHQAQDMAQQAREQGNAINLIAQSIEVVSHSLQGNLSACEKQNAQASRLRQLVQQQQQQIGDYQL